MSKRNQSFLTVLAYAIALTATSNTAAEGHFVGHEFKTKFRLMHFDRDFGNDRNDRDQTALGIEVNYTSPQFSDFIGVGISSYHVQEIDKGGRLREDILTAEPDGSLEGFSLFGQAFLNITPGGNFAVKVGRMKHRSMLLNSSTSRAVPSTFQGVSATFKPIQGLKLFASVYDKWSRRARDNFEGFATDESNPGDINYVGVIGATYKINSLKFDTEYLESDDYLRKFGLRGKWTNELSEDTALDISGSIFTSSDNGDLFVTGAEGRDLDDEDAAGSMIGSTRSENDGLGAYINFGWTKENARVTLALAKFDDISIEDNFSGDHGRNPFPTRSRVGPDLRTRSRMGTDGMRKTLWTA